MRQLIVSSLNSFALIVTENRLIERMMLDGKLVIGAQKLECLLMRQKGVGKRRDELFSVVSNILGDIRGERLKIAHLVGVNCSLGNRGEFVAIVLREIGRIAKELNEMPKKSVSVATVMLRIS